MEKVHRARLGQRERMADTVDIDGKVVRLREIEANGRGAVDYLVVRPRDLVELRVAQPQARLGHIAPQRLRDGHRRAVVGAHLRGAVDQRGHRMTGGDEPRAHFAAEQPGGAGDQYACHDCPFAAGE